MLPPTIASKTSGTDDASVPLFWENSNWFRHRKTRTDAGVPGFTENRPTGKSPRKIRLDIVC